uniref:Fibronectin type-II domain-containing protein n=1 Tax=Gopherus evgoodei TaxID=1825980 RepID=A0A8C5F0I4_9SAUR
GAASLALAELCVSCHSVSVSLTLSLPVSDCAACVFPFIYQGRSYPTCTQDGSWPRRFWCATTRNYDRDRRWSYLLAGNSTAPCAFPFTYQNQTYLGCTAHGDASGRPWCSLTRNYDVDQKRMYCLDSGRGQGEGQNYMGLCCLARPMGTQHPLGLVGPRQPHCSLGHLSGVQRERDAQR